ncbi:hypothetical protein VaNZ11_008036 [Volvox africanus]|uniref:VPS9 domain-containing protein n=1 Tax=Volvox africanus TaxID=51714 RepID=A0ABQ5S453_9CHLO|nr:hypothetical protein VaNZ11_008036 [Volvox africanus]
MGEPFQASISQLSFEKFINTINQDQAKDLVRNINQFMKKFRSRPPDNEIDSREVQEFLTSMEHAFARHPLWAGSTREDLDNAVEGLEKYLMTKLYDRTFGMDPLDRERDAVLSRRLAALAGFVTPAHLEVTEQFQVPLASGEGGHVVAACKELKKMSLFKSPRDKLVQILNCCKIINDFLTSRRAGAGADDFTPALIYVTIKAQPEALASNMAFIERYRYSNRLNGESEYFFVQMQGAVAFLETLSPTSLAGCEADEFISHMLAAGAISEGELSEEQVAAQRRRTAAAAAAGGHVSTAKVLEATAAAPVYGNPMLASRQVQQHQQHPQGLHAGAVYGSGAPPPPPPPPSLQPSAAPYPVPGAPSYYAAGYPPGHAAVVYGQPTQYYTQYTAPGIPYGQQWVAAPAPAAVPPPPPPPPAKPAPPPPAAAPLQQASQFVPLPPKSVSELERDGVRLVIKAEAAGELRAKYPYLYCTKETLTLNDVSQLLVLYKELVLRYETLAQAVENNVVKYFSDLEAYQAGLRTVPPGTTITTSTAGSPQQPPPPPPAPPSQQHHAQQQEPELVSIRNPPPPPPPPAIAVVAVTTTTTAAAAATAINQQQPTSIQAVPQPSSSPAPAPQREPLDLSQYMPSYQLEMEGWPYQAKIQVAAETANADVNATATAATQQAAGAAPFASTGAFIDLLSDYTPPPPPSTSPPPAAEAVVDSLHPQLLQQHQAPSPQPPQPPLQQQQLPLQLSPTASYGGGDDGDDKELTPPSSVRNASAAELSYAAESRSSPPDDGALTAAIRAAVAPDAAPAARYLDVAGVVESTSGDTTSTAGAAVPFSAVDGCSGGADSATGSLPFLEATLSPPPPPLLAVPPALSLTISEAGTETMVALALPPADAPIGPSTCPDQQDQYQWQQHHQSEHLQSLTSRPPPQGADFSMEPLLLDVQESQPASSGLSNERLAPLALVDVSPTAAAAATSSGMEAPKSPRSLATSMAAAAVQEPLPCMITYSDATGITVGTDGDGKGGDSSGAVHETEEERRARVDALLQQFLGGMGGGTVGEEQGQGGAEMPVIPADSAAAVDAVLAIYCIGTAAEGAVTEGVTGTPAVPLTSIEAQADADTDANAGAESLRKKPPTL